jgi:dTDP-4-amino-4,6-dideoxygalactose transaminase
MNTIPLIDLQKQYLSIKDEIDTEILSLISSSSFIGGQVVKRFESEFSSAIRVKHTVGVGNGTDSLTLILKALNIGIGDEVIVPANSFIATSEAVTLTGAKPVFIDCLEDEYTIDPSLIRYFLETQQGKGKGKVKAIIAVHLYGCPARMDDLEGICKEYNLLLLEDAAQSHLAEFKGRMIGSIGIAGSFSFYPGKNLGAYGDAGAVTTDDNELAILIRKLANHGRIGKYDHEIEGTNSRLDTLQAGVLSIKLKHLDTWTNERIRAANRYTENLNHSGLRLPITPEGAKHVFHLYVVRIPNQQRKFVSSFLESHGISSGIHYPTGLPFLKAYASQSKTSKDYPVTFKLQDEILSLPLYPELKNEEIDFISEKLIEATKNV